MTDQNRKIFRADALIGADGVRSVVREQLFGDPPRVSGHVVYRAVVPAEDMPADLRMNAPVLWAGPNCHLVHYPLRAGEQYNLVVTFHSRQPEVWSVTDGSKEEVLSYFHGICARPRQLLDLPQSWRRWSTADRNPIPNWTQGRITLLGDAALRLYEQSRVTRTARVVLSAREMGRLYHASGVERLVRNQLWQGRTPDRFYDALEWLYSWRAENCLAVHPPPGLSVTVPA